MTKNDAEEFERTVALYLDTTLPSLLQKLGIRQRVAFAAAASERAISRYQYPPILRQVHDAVWRAIAADELSRLDLPSMETSVDGVAPGEDEESSEVRRNLGAVLCAYSLLNSCADATVESCVEAADAVVNTLDRIASEMDIDPLPLFRAEQGRQLSDIELLTSVLMTQERIDELRRRSQAVDIGRL